METYSGLAGIYDLLMDDFDYAKWADYYIALISGAGGAPSRLCDCACGTGAMTIEFARRGINALGVDISPEMLERASAKSRAAGMRIVFAKQDMCALRLPRPVDVITCACDGVNYLLTEARLEKFFTSVYENLKPGGCFAFDFSSRAKLEGRLGDAFFGEEREDVAYIWQNSLNGQTHIIDMDITFFVREPGGLYRRFSENHRQRAYTPEEIGICLKNAGFADIEAFGDMNFNAPTDSDMRIHMRAIRSGRRL